MSSFLCFSWSVCALRVCGTARSQKWSLFLHDVAYHHAGGWQWDGHIRKDQPLEVAETLKCQLYDLGQLVESSDSSVSSVQFFKSCILKTGVATKHFRYCLADSSIGETSGGGEQGTGGAGAGGAAALFPVLSACPILSWFCIYALEPPSMKSQLTKLFPCNSLTMAICF